MTSPQLPIIHLNGSGKESLERDYLAQLEAVNRALEVAVANGPHGRDYYPLGEAAFDLALAQHQARVKSLLTVSQELQDLLIGIADGGAK